MPFKGTGMTHMLRVPLESAPTARRWEPKAAIPMSKILGIVESPTKAKTLRNFLKGLPDKYLVESSVGHVRDLPHGADEIPAKYKGEKWASLGVKVDEDFEPLYVVRGDVSDEVWSVGV